MTDATMSHADVSSESLRARILRMPSRNAFSGTTLCLVEAEVGRAMITMEVGPAQMNGHGTCHGGALWTLADMVFGAAGYYDGTILTTGSDLTFIRPVPGGATIHASAAQISRRGLSGIFTVVLTLDPAIPTRWWPPGPFPAGGSAAGAAAAEAERQVRVPASRIVPSKRLWRHRRRPAARSPPWPRTGPA